MSKTTIDLPFTPEDVASGRRERVCSFSESLKKLLREVRHYVEDDALRDQIDDALAQQCAHTDK